jgi:hypothetical protein
MAAKKRVYVIISVLCLVVGSAARAQLIDYDKLDTVVVFRSLDKAMATPEVVIRLDLSKQKLQAFPMEIFQMPNLQELVLDKCRITQLPDEFKALPLLQRLSCGHNEIEQIPPSLCSLNNLRTLNLSDNIIDKIPDKIDRLTALETLALWDNQISYYPERLTEMQQLRVLDLLNNAMSRETQERLRTGLPQCKIIMSPPCACMDGED